MQVERISRGGVNVLIADDYLGLDLSAVAAPTLLARGVEGGAWIGPLLGAADSICYDCFAFYLSLRPQPPPATFPDFARPLLDRAAELASAILVVKPDGGAERVTFRSRGDCPVCGRRPLGSDANLEVLGHPLSGIVERVREAPPVAGLHVAVSGVRIPPEVAADRSERVFATGKGGTPAEARRVLTLEAAERYSSFYTGLERVVLGTADEVGACALETLFLLSPAQYAAGVESVQPLDRATEALWAPAKSLLDGREIAIPAGSAYLDYVYPIEPRYHLADTSGCAAGETLDDAIQRALLEAIERDALAIWWYNQAPRPELIVDRGEVPLYDAASAALAEAGRGLRLIDLTHDLGAPVVAAVSAAEDGGAIYLGAAAALSTEDAARRAVEELLQFWEWDRFSGSVPRTRRAWIGEGNCRDFPFLEPGARARRRVVLESSLVEALAARGLHPCYIDLTRPELEISVVRAVVPGLRHHRRRFAPGRLFDVPVQLGWLDRPRAESEMNPYPCPL